MVAREKSVVNEKSPKMVATQAIIVICFVYIEQPMTAKIAQTVNRDVLCSYTYF
jgi:hypothetical protein